MQNKNKKILIKYKNYFILFFFIFLISFTTNFFSNYKYNFKSRFNIIFDFKHASANYILKGPLIIHNQARATAYVDMISKNNINYFMQDLEDEESYLYFLNQVNQKLNNSNLIGKMDNADLFFITHVRKPKSYITNKYTATITTGWADVKTLQQISNELQKIILASREEAINSSRESLLTKYKYIINQIKSECKISNEYKPDLKSNDFSRWEIFNKQCTVALSRIEKDRFFENLMMINVDKTKAFQRIVFIINIEKPQVKSIFQLIYKNILSSVLMLVSILILRNFIIKISK